MDRSLARGAPPPDPRGSRLEPIAARATVATGLAIVLAMLLIYSVSNPLRRNTYNHFVWQASAWLEGEAAIRYPVRAADGLGAENWYFQDVLRVVDDEGAETGRALIPFPPLPAVVLLPFVAVFGVATNAALIAMVLGALVVGLAFWVLGRLPVRPSVRLATTIALGLGTVFWYAAQLGSTWYLAHVVAVGLTLLSIAVALDADPAAVASSAHDDREDGEDPGPVPATGPPQAGRPETSAPHEAGDTEASAPGPASDQTGEPRGGERPGEWLRAALPLDGRQVLAGFLLGLAATARLPVVLGLPFLALVGGGHTWQRRALSAAVGAAIPVAGLLLYNYVSAGQPFHPAYEHLYRVEIGFYPLIFPYLEYHADWAIEDPRYIPQNLLLMLGGLPEVMPSCDVAGAARGWFDEACPYVRPRADGMSLLLVSPILLVGLPALRAWGKERLITGAALAILLIALINLAHFSQGWVQFGYRFSNDFIPFALLLVALGMERLGGVRWWIALLLLASILVNLWGIGWSRVLGW